MTTPDRPLRLLPWTDDLGRPSYLIPAEGGDGMVSRLADKVEAEQLDAGAEYLAYLHELRCHSDKLPTAELESLVQGLAESLHNSLRVAHSRGDRLGSPGIEDFHDDADETEEPEESANDADEPDETDETEEPAEDADEPDEPADDAYEPDEPGHEDDAAGNRIP